MREIPDISILESKLTRLSTMRDMVESSIESTQEEIIDLEEEVEVLGMVSELFRSLIDREIEQSVVSLKRLQSKGMAVVFDDQEVSVEASVKVQRGKVSVDLETCQGGSHEDVMEAYGGSVATLQSVLLRLMVMMRRRMRLCMFLDESLPAFHPEYARNMSKFFRTLCKKVGLDMMVITQSSELTEFADKVYEVRKGKSGVFFEEITGRQV